MTFYRFAALIQLIWRDGIDPGGTIFQCELGVFAGGEAVPIRVFPFKISVDGTVSEAFPMGSILHKEVDRTKLPLRHAISSGIRIVTFPEGVFAIEPDIDLPLGTHTAIGHEITGDGGLIVSGTDHLAIIVSLYIDIDCTCILRHKLTIGADGRPGTINSCDIATADIYSGRYSTDRFIRSTPIFICFAVSHHIDQSSHSDLAGTFRAIHGLDAHATCLGLRFTVNF